MSRTLLGVVAAVLVVVVVLTLYATGPSKRAGRTRCPATTVTAAIAVCVLSPDGKRAYVAVRTNAWERFRGAITGTP